MPRILARAGLAMKIARLDRIAFNEAVNNDHLRCVPKTRPGSARLFDEDDLAMLCIFSQLLDLGLTPRAAGPLACEFKGILSAYPDEDRLVFVKPTFGSAHILPGSQFIPDYRKEGKSYSGVGEVALALDLHVVAIRSHIARELEQERNTLGRDDEEG